MILHAGFIDCRLSRDMGDQNIMGVEISFRQTIVQIETGLRSQKKSLGEATKRVLIAVNLI